jgi:hypothetical protein
MVGKQRRHLTPRDTVDGCVRATGLWRWYINVTITTVDIIDRPVFDLKHTVGNVRTSQETHTSPVPTQQNNAIYRFVKMVY